MFVNCWDSIPVQSEVKTRSRICCNTFCKTVGQNRKSQRDLAIIVVALMAIVILEVLFSSYPHYFTSASLHACYIGAALPLAYGAIFYKCIAVYFRYLESEDRVIRRLALKENPLN